MKFVMILFKANLLCYVIDVRSDFVINLQTNFIPTGLFTPKKQVVANMLPAVMQYLKISGRIGIVFLS